ncbi:glycosyltransferase [Oscillatoria sp. FACHB-1407]|uniref:glycosyltransferase n=1 Tax=Oscillatoria sp. FACHB-1407 TaxID=2692847 RepID=UPI001682FA38|nr:glycosyltransferase [Oscillatoria sp. FACHB-1407]MBD2459697.1 glycosyltransferase [Oscillatoria sp. FACHB-1407]
MKIALVHDYLTQRGGAERVFELLCKQFPDADIFTSIYSPKTTIDLSDRIVYTTDLQRIPGSAKYFRLLAPLYFEAFRRLDFSSYDLIISSTSSFAKAVRKRPEAKHICFCHNVTRFLWDTKTYLREYGKYRKFYPALEKIFQYMRKIDLGFSQEPDIYIANSTTVGDRIQRIYNRPAFVVNYPIDISKFIFSNQKDNFFLVSSRLLSYKRVDSIVEAFNWLGLPLIIAGDGPERQQLEAKALSNVQFLGYVSDAERTYLMSKARAVIVAALEDYGLVPIEANASGTPVLAFGAGGVLDSQVPGVTGLFFNRQTPDAIQSAVLNFKTIDWDYERIRNHVLSNFTEEVFFKKVEKIVSGAFDGQQSQIF